MAVRSCSPHLAELDGGAADDDLPVRLSNQLPKRAPPA
jgi:hypothetical protein